MGGTFVTLVSLKELVFLLVLSSICVCKVRLQVPVVDFIKKKFFLTKTSNPSFS